MSVWINEISAYLHMMLFLLLKMMGVQHACFAALVVAATQRRCQCRPSVLMLRMMMGRMLSMLMGRMIATGA